MTRTKVVTWNGAASTNVEGLVITQVTKGLLGAQRGSFIDVPGREGFYHFSQPRGRRTVTVEAFVEADSFPEARRANITELADWLDVIGQAKLILGDDPGVYYEAVLESVPDLIEWRDWTELFEIVWVTQPYAFDMDVEEESWTDDNNHTHNWTLDLKMPLYPVIEITPTNGTLSQFTLTTNGEALTYSGLVNSGDTLTINSIAPIVVSGSNTDLELTGVYNPVTRSMSGVAGAFPTLIPGGNSITFVRQGGTATSFSFTVSYRRKYRR